MKFRQTLTLGDATSTANGKTLYSDRFNDVWKLRVPAQQKKTFGYGAIQGGVDDRGVLYIDAKDDQATPAQIEGKVRLSLRDANEVQEIVILEERTERLRGSKVDLSQAYRVAEAPVKAKEDSYLVISIKPDTDTVGKFSTSNSDFAIPVTTII